MTHNMIPKVQSHITSKKGATTTTFITLAALAGMIALTTPTSYAFAAKPAFGSLYYDGDAVRTLVPPSSFPNEGKDTLYSVTNGVEGQFGIAAVAPGDVGYHGGAWKVYVVTFNEGVTPYLLTSDEAVKQAEDDGDVSIMRAPDADFRCPIQP